MKKRLLWLIPVILTVVIIVRSSLGGYLTQYLLATYPQRVGKAVLGNTFPKNDTYEEQNHTRVALASWLPEWAVMNALRQNLFKQIDHSTTDS